MNFFVFTWNMHGTAIIPHLPQGAASSDMIILALQECAPSPSMAERFPEHKFYKEEEMGGLRTIILGRAGFIAKIKKIGLGPLGFINKGFIAVNINDEILHMNAHLAAHPEGQRTRMQQILTMLGACRDERFETIILSGDLNFRMVDGKDQALEFQRTYAAFREDRIAFQPTFKYDGDRLSPRRVPSFCDRVFVASRRDLRFLAYSSVDGILLSDHKPVYCRFEVSGSPRKCDLLAVRGSSTRGKEILTKLYRKAWKSPVPAAAGVMGLLGIGAYYFRH